MADLVAVSHWPITPHPLSWRKVADQLSELQPEAGFREEVGEPVGDALNDNVLTELVQLTTLMPPDLAVLDAGTG